jgi:hypothetical protein
MAAAVLVPLAINAGIMGVGLLINKFRKRGTQKRAASQIADEVEALMQQNLQAFLASDRTEADKQAALQNFDDLWNEFVRQVRLYGAPGEQGILDRQREPVVGDRLPGVDWFALYRDPIANAMVSSATTTSSIIPGLAIALLGLGLVAYDRR